MGGGTRRKAHRPRCAHPPFPTQQDPSSLPFRATPHDALRLGLPSYKEAAVGPTHPAEAAARAVSWF